MCIFYILVKSQGNLHNIVLYRVCENWTCHMASKACPEFESSNSKILTSHGGSEISKGVFMESLVQPLGSPENHGEFMCFWLKYDIYIYIFHMIYVHIELKWIIYILFVYILKPCLSCWESAAYCRYLEASYSRILNVWISQPLAKPVSSKRSLQNNDIITKIINDPIIASTLKCQCVCVCVGDPSFKNWHRGMLRMTPCPSAHQNQRLGVAGLHKATIISPDSSKAVVYYTHIKMCAYQSPHKSYDTWIKYPYTQHSTNSLHLRATV